MRDVVDPVTLLERLIEGAVGLLSAERGFVLLRRGEGLVPVASHSIADTRAFVSVSSTVYGTAMRKGTTVCIEDSSTDPRCDRAKSLAAVELPRSILCGPLMVDEAVVGVIYVDMPRLPDGVAANHVAALDPIVQVTSELLRAAHTRQRILAAQERIEAMTSAQDRTESLILGPKLRDVILKCMEKNPDGRYQRCVDLEADLKQAQREAIELEKDLDSVLFS